MFGQNICNTASQEIAGGIAKDTVGKLTVAWTYKAAGADVSATPAVVGGSVYFPDWSGKINRLDALTGKVTWSKDVAALLTSAGYPGSLGGWVSRGTPLVTNGLVIFGTVRDPPNVITQPGAGSYLVAIDQDTAAVKWVTLLDTHLASVVSGSPVLDSEKGMLFIGVASQEEYGGLASAFGVPYTCCSFRGSAVAVDVSTGMIKWKTSTITDDLFYGDAGVPEAGPVDAGPPDAAPASVQGFAGDAIWSSTPVIDRANNQLIVTTGDNYKMTSPSAVGVIPGNWVDSIVALDLGTGMVNWVDQLPGGGTATSDAFSTGGMYSGGIDSDFGAGAQLFTATVNGAPEELVGAGQKSGVYFAVNAKTGKEVWKTKVGPGGGVGGIHWGTATDGVRVYMQNNNTSGMSLTLMGPNGGGKTTTGTWTALDTATGNVVWQAADPAPPKAPSTVTVNGPVTVVNGVMFGGSMDAAGTMVALDASNGSVLWKFQSGGTVYGGPAIAGGMVFWGSGYPGGGLLTAKRPLGFGAPSTKGQLFAFKVP
jgi:polyvinyl alcohol dehydrogenase (cytochrome)